MGQLIECGKGFPGVMFKGGVGLSRQEAGHGCSGKVSGSWRRGRGGGCRVVGFAIDFNGLDSGS